MPTSSLPNSISANLTKLKHEMDQACQCSGRDKSDISLIAVSKGQDFLAIKTAHKLGLRDFGENYAQEFIGKLKESRALGLNLRWHFIGAIQSNKINLIKEADVVHSIASMRHAKLLDQALSKPIECFLQVNLEPSDKRSGFSPEEIKAVLSQKWPFGNLTFLGLMTILPLEPNVPKSHWFNKMAKLKEEVLKLGQVSLVGLSMGMSDDFQEAIAHGADFIRIGTKIFGSRS